MRIYANMLPSSDFSVAYCSRTVRDLDFIFNRVINIDIYRRMFLRFWIASCSVWNCLQGNTLKRSGLTLHDFELALPCPHIIRHRPRDEIY